MNIAYFYSIRPHHHTSLGTAEAVFVPLARPKSGSTNLPEGVVHVFRDLAEKRSPEELESSLLHNVNDDSDGGVMLGVLAVPSWMTPSDFLAFVAPAADGMAHLRLIR